MCVQEIGQCGFSDQTRGILRDSRTDLVLRFEKELEALYIPSHDET